MVQTSPFCTASDMKDTVKGITDVLNVTQDKNKESKKSSVKPLDDKEKKAIKTDETTSADGIKEALIIGIQKAVQLTGVQDGFYKNELIKIGMPEKLQKADKMIRQVGGIQASEMLIEKMNRAAEKAVPEAEKIFVDAIKGMKIEDATKILTGSNDSATLYLKEKTSDSLSKSFYPVIKSTMEEINALKTFNDYIGNYSSNPLLQAFDLNVDINQHVTEKSIEGLFRMVAEQEKDIRQNPAARVTDLLKIVFGGK